MSETIISCLFLNQMEDLRKLKEEEVKNLEIKREEDLKMYAAQHQVK